jgi:hypothetical protein
MSNLNSVFDTLRGWPQGSALEFSFQPKKGVTIEEGKVVSGLNRELADAVVFNLVDDSLVTSPTVTYADKGKAYHVAGVGGDWSGFTIGDIIEWDGSAWVLILAGSGGTPVGPPDNTRVVASATPGSGASFLADAKKTLVFSTGTPGSWAAAETPDDGARIFISAGIYADKFFDYNGTHPAGGWRQAADQERAAEVMAVYSSLAWDGTLKGAAWLVFQGNDQSDAAFVNKVTCLKLQSGCTFKIQSDDADSLVAGTFVEAASGVIQALTDKWPIGLVVWTNGTAGAGGQIAIASM